MTDYYKTLGLQSTATQFEIKEAFRKLSLKFHPDQNSDDKQFTEIFKNIKDAYDVLSDPQKRKIYDNQLLSSSNTYIQDSKSKTYSYKEPTSESIKKLAELIPLYFRKRQLAEELYRSLKEKENIPVPKYVTPIKIIGILALIATVCILYIPDYSKYMPDYSNKHTKQNNSSTDIAPNVLWVTTKYTNVYSEPDIDSRIIGSISSGLKLTALQETKYFIKTKVKVKNNGYEKEGYIRKKHLTQELSKKTISFASPGITTIEGFESNELQKPKKDFSQTNYSDDFVSKYKLNKGYINTNADKEFEAKWKTYIRATANFLQQKINGYDSTEIAEKVKQLEEDVKAYSAFLSVDCKMEYLDKAKELKYKVEQIERTNRL